MKKTVIIVLFLLLCPVWAVLGQQSEKEWEPFKDVKDQKRQELAGQQAGQALTNESIVKLVKAGLSEDTIISIVNTQPGKYSLSAEDVINLKNVGVSEKIISALLTKGSAAPSSLTNDVSAPALPADVGVYWKKNGNWIQLLPEVVNWQTGGAIKSYVTLDIVKGDVNGRVYGKHSKTGVATPVEFLFRLAEGTEITEYQLIHCREHSGNREFRTVTGGVFHVSGGAKRDLIRFDFTKTGERAFTVKMSNLETGEYGFLPPGSAIQSSAAAQFGKMYTFRVE
jgi:hypothetical protein